MWVEAGFPPETFWRQTARSFSNALAGAARTRIKTAWQQAMFIAAASIGKLGPLEQFLEAGGPVGTRGAMKALSYMMRLQKRGVGMTIERIERRPKR